MFWYISDSSLHVCINTDELMNKLDRFVLFGFFACINIHRRIIRRTEICLSVFVQTTDYCPANVFPERKQC